MATLSVTQKCQTPISAFLETMETLKEFKSNLFEEATTTGATPLSETFQILLNFQLDRADAVLTLVLQNMPWDAEIVLRSGYEAAVKIIFIASKKEEERYGLLREYWTILGHIYDKKQADRAELPRKMAEQHNARQSKIFEFLQNPAVFNLDRSYSKQFRQSLEQKWSFTEILKNLENPKDGQSPFSGIQAFGHTYGMASHLAHASSKAMELMLDRQTRGEDLLILAAAHICRILSDAVSLACFSLHFIDVAINHATDVNPTLVNSLNRIHASTKSIIDEFHLSQESFYSRFEKQDN